MILRLSLVLALVFSVLSPALAQERPKRDDTVSYTLSAEEWVTTKTARVTLSVEASVTSANAGEMRTEMTKAVNNAAKGDWRLTEFNRTLDQTGMERWSVSFEARIPEASLNGLPDAVKKASKAGMQVKVSDIDFSPTLEESETVRAALRTKLLKSAAEQLATLNSTLPGRNYRISEITFGQHMPVPGMPRAFRSKSMMMDNAMMTAASAPEAAPAQERAEKMVLQANIVYAAAPPAAANAH